MDTGPSGSAVDIAENRMSTSKEDVDGRWLFVSFKQSRGCSFMVDGTYAMPPLAIVRPFCRDGSPEGSSFR
jgi:hypothetical protein